MRKYIIVGLLFALAAGTAYTELNKVGVIDTGNIVNIWCYKDYSPVKNANISIYKYAGQIPNTNQSLIQPIKNGKTDNHGTLRFMQITAGKYRVSASCNNPVFGNTTPDKVFPFSSSGYGSTHSSPASSCIVFEETKASEKIHYFDSERLALLWIIDYTRQGILDNMHVEKEH
jgi:hypothetical protein